MNNIIDYIGSYGHLTFAGKPFNKVDALIMSQFSYLKLEGFVPAVGSDEDNVTIGSIAKRDDVDLLFIDERYAENNRALFYAMAGSERFRNVGLNHFIDLVSNKWEMQFSALTVYLDGQAAHVVFRGTDETIIGWKEDFNMSFMTPIPSQVKAVDYLHYAAERIRGRFSVGGHSKGGNLAVYSAMKCSPYVRERITDIYSQDGPGFTKETFEGADYDSIKDRIRKYVPRSSIVGMLLQSQEEYRVIEARSVGILQHDPFNWEVSGDDFVYVDDIAGRYVISDEAVNEWAKRADPEEMKVFVNSLYDLFVAIGVTDLNDFKGNWTSIMQKAKAFTDNMDEDDKKRIREVLRILFDSFRDQIKDQITNFAIR